MSKINQRGKNKFSKIHFIFTTLISILSFLGFYFLFSKTGSVKLSQIFLQKTNGYLSDATIVTVGIIFISIVLSKILFLSFLGWYNFKSRNKGFLIAIAVILFAPSNIFAFSKIYPLFINNADLAGIIVWSAILFALFFSVLVLSASKIFEAVLFFAVSQTTLAFSTLASSSMWRCVYYLLGYMFFGLLFILCIQTIYSIVKTSNLKRISTFSYFAPVTYFCFWVVSLSIIGIFPFWGFFTKKEIYTYFYIYDINIYVLVVSIFLITILYQTRFLVKLFYGRKRFIAKPNHKEANFSMLFCQIMLAVILLFAGVAFGYNDIFRNMTVWEISEFSVPAFVNIYFIFAVIVGIVLAVYIYSRKEVTLEFINKKINFLPKFSKFLFRG